MCAAECDIAWLRGPLPRLADGTSRALCSATEMARLGTALFSLIYWPLAFAVMLVGAVITLVLLRRAFEGGSIA